jgi:hypothetical protein
MKVRNLKEKHFLFSPESVPIATLWKLAFLWRNGSVSGRITNDHSSCSRGNQPRGTPTTNDAQNPKRALSMLLVWSRRPQLKSLSKQDKNVINELSKNKKLLSLNF